MSKVMKSFICRGCLNPVTSAGRTSVDIGVTAKLELKKERKDDDDWVKKCMEHEVEGPRPRGRPKKTWKEVVREDCQARKLNKEDAMDRCKWRKMIKEAR